MGDRSTIEWTDATWNPVTGCTHVSEGCRYCYAERVLPRTGQSFDKVVCHPDRLEAPLHWRKPRRIFVNSLSDLFHEDVPDEFIRTVFKVMGEARQHTFQVLTKRPERMRAYTQSLLDENDFPTLSGSTEEPFPWSNVWLGISCEDQKTADERIPLLLQTPAAVRFISAEPLLGPIDLSRIGGKSAMAYRMIGVEPRRLDWVIVGGESGPHARPMHPDWARSLRDQCFAVDVPFFFKQWGEWAPDEMLDSERGTTARSRQVDGIWMTRFGKKAAGRILDGRTWDELPKGVR